MVEYSIIAIDGAFVVIQRKRFLFIPYWSAVARYDNYRSALDHVLDAVASEQ